jgi:predicted DNA-binding transcriptional regulator YafY
MGGGGLHEFQSVRAGLRHMPMIRRAIREKRKLCIGYRSLAGEPSDRIIRPLQTDYWGKAWTLSAWCERRNDFRAFRVDLIASCAETGERFDDEPGKTVGDYLRLVDERLSVEKCRYVPHRRAARKAHNDRGALRQGHSCITARKQFLKRWCAEPKRIARKAMSPSARRLQQGPTATGGS